MEKINCVFTLMAVIDTIHTHPYTHMSFLSHKLKIIETVLLYIVQRPTTASLSLAMTGNYGPNDLKRTTSISPSVVTCIFAIFVCENEAEVRRLLTEMRNINR